MWILKSYQELTKEELHNILQERVRVFIVEQNCPYQDLDDYDVEAYHLFYQQDGEIRAYLRILPPNTKYEEASIGRVIVKKEYRGQGLAKQMLQKSIQFLEEELNISTIKIQAQSYLREFYGSFGFVPITEEYLEDNIPHYDMIRNTK